ncbi:formyltetrahydrofolate deformylase [Actinospongicola halichondriae]|uniref:formyltetrahydrofolate deformylase n=1 Tax=Actinospongicola halichondriae TaxID=3236844 RepID=UPI003D535A48
MNTVLLLRCPDRPGIVAAVGQTIAALGGNIVHADQHTDRVHGLFLQRVEATFPPDADIDAAMAPVSAAYGMTWTLHRPGPVPRLAVLVSQQGHCLADLLTRIDLGELRAEVAVVVSNHETHGGMVERHGAPFRHLPVGDEPEMQADAVQGVVRDSDADLVVLARYMRILPPSFVDEFPNRIINIHHSFLPAFAGAKPYHQAFERGVKIIGATAHYATSVLDEGPIIHQDVTPVSHRHEVEDLVRLGADLERTVLARAVRLHLEHRVLTYANRTVVFD